MTIDIGRPGDRRNLTFGSGDSEQKERDQERFRESGFSGFDTDVTGVSEAVKKPHVMEIAFEEHSPDEIAEATDLKERFVQRCLLYHGLIDPEDTDLPDAVAENASRYAPWEPNPHPDRVSRQGQGDASKSPW